MAKWVSTEKALQKLQRYCAYQDRCHQEVRAKLLDMGIYGESLEGIIAQLIEDNFLNEERFARSFARGKFRMKQWGRLRIRRELKKRNISAYCLRKAMEEIDEESYRRALRELIQKKAAAMGEEEKPSTKINKAGRYALGKGFEAELVWPIAKELFSE